jgi:hypothetical protein
MHTRSLELTGGDMRKNLRVLFAAGLTSCLLGNVCAAQGPIAVIASKMTGVAGELAKTTTGEPVQKQQQVVLRDLDELIAALERECQACRNGMKKNNPRRGMPDSMISSGTGGSGPLVEPGAGNKDWAKLSSRERDRILQSMSEGFPPEYRTVLERYYRRLAEEVTTPTSGDRAQPKDAGATSGAGAAAARPSEKP